MLSGMAGRQLYSTDQLQDAIESLLRDPPVEKDENALLQDDAETGCHM
jgi:hypothetical protein